MQDGSRVSAQDGRGTTGGNRAEEGGADGVGLARTGDDAGDFAGAHECGDGEGEGVGGHSFEGVEAAVMDLLLAAEFVEFDEFYESGIVEVGDGRIVESEVGILADAEAGDVDGIFGEEGGVAGDLLFGWSFGADEMHGTRCADVGEEVLAKKAAEAGGMGVEQGHIFVHVKADDFRPIDGLGGEFGEEFTLRWCAGEEDAGFAACADGGADREGNARRRVATERGAVGVLEDIEKIEAAGFHSRIWKRMLNNAWACVQSGARVWRASKVFVDQSHGRMIFRGENSRRF